MDCSNVNENESLEQPSEEIAECETKTISTDDALFKVPASKEDVVEDEATIALRTRSKLSLNSTPLEVIEESFVPPDITMDMYDLECDDEDWANFLKTFTKPLDEVTKIVEDEELDPEYNILADEEIEDVGE